MVLNTPCDVHPFDSCGLHTIGGWWGGGQIHVHAGHLESRAACPIISGTDLLMLESPVGNLIVECLVEPDALIVPLTLKDLDITAVNRCKLRHVLVGPLLLFWAAGVGAWVASSRSKAGNDTGTSRVNRVRSRVYEGRFMPGTGGVHYVHQKNTFRNRSYS